MTRDYLLFLEDIRDRIEKIETFIHGMNYADFKTDDRTVSACIREIEVIGEATKHLPKEIIEQFPDLPWSLMAKMRDKLSTGILKLMKRLSGKSPKTSCRQSKRILFTS
jgi:uncharacterized protein with HEPN domain